MKKLKLWEKFERDIQTELGLRKTIASGNKWHDPGDGVSPNAHPIPVIVDCKDTEQKSYSLRHDFLDEWLQIAAEQGQTFLLPIRFENAEHNKDYIVLSLEDFLMFWESSRKYLLEN